MKMARSDAPREGATTLSQKVRRGELHTVDCPSRAVLKNLTSLWGVLVLLALQEGTLRYSELRRKSAGVSEKMLSQTLKSLENDGLVERTSYPVIPPRVEYSLTPLGQEAAEHVASLADWIEVNMFRVMQARQKRHQKNEGGGD